MRSLDDFKDQAFYWEACRLQAEQRDRLGADNNERRSNVVFLSEYRRSKRRLGRQPMRVVQNRRRNRLKRSYDARSIRRVSRQRRPEL